MPAAPPSPGSKLHPVYTVSNIQHKVRVLDGTKVTYSAWVKLFQLHARGYKVLNHIDATSPPAKNSTTYVAWAEIDAHVLQWIFGTLSDDLLARVLIDESTAYDAWMRVSHIFLNNKGARAVALEQEFNNLKLESMSSLQAYCQRLRDLAAQLKDVDAGVNEQRLVLQLVRGLPTKFDTVASYIHQTLPSFETAQSMLELEQHRKSGRDDTTAPPMVLVAPTHQPDQGNRPPPTNRQQPPRHDNRNNTNGRGRGRTNGNRPPGQNRNQQWSPWPPQWQLPPCPYPTYPWTAPTWGPWNQPPAAI